MQSSLQFAYLLTDALIKTIKHICKRAYLLSALHICLL